jgi:hypothetical protein
MSEENSEAWDPCIETLSRNTIIGGMLGFALCFALRGRSRGNWAVFGAGIGGGVSAADCQNYIWPISQLPLMKKD